MLRIAYRAFQGTVYLYRKILVGTLIATHIRALFLMILESLNRQNLSNSKNV
ncbi:hypothetical protein VPHD394_0211 [Vibrio phage D394]